jgi:AcrR family transcriptional regulator
MGRPTSDPARDTRRDILQAALDLFAEHGFHGASMRALAAAAGVRESAIYHYFPSKTALLAAIAADFAGENLGELESVMAEVAEHPLEEQLTVLTQRALAIVSTPRYRKLARVMLVSGAELGTEAESGEPLWRRISEEPRRVLGRIHAQLKRSGRLRDDLDLEMFHIHFIAPIVLASGALFGGEGKGPISMTVPRFVRQHVAFLLNALSASAAAPPPSKPSARR